LDSPRIVQAWPVHEGSQARATSVSGAPAYQRRTSPSTGSRKCNQLPSKVTAIPAGHGDISLKSCADSTSALLLAEQKLIPCKECLKGSGSVWTCRVFPWNRGESTQPAAHGFSRVHDSSWDLRGRRANPGFARSVRCAKAARTPGGAQFPLSAKASSLLSPLEAMSSRSLSVSQSLSMKLSKLGFRQLYGMRPQFLLPNDGRN
jgi:hypothetical protein